ncbi:MAG: SIS domain-containing protein [Lacrimispora sp.]|uniref:SIS domain-containing protein n=1 Tax=Lacrimispora sp. TaxID=2719234 RepID=UPI0039E5AEBF
MTFTERYQKYVKTILSENEAVFLNQDMEELQNFIFAIKRSERLFVVGAGREGIAARSFAMRLMHLGKETYWLWDDTTPGMKEGDLCLMVNGSGKIGHIDYLAEQTLHTGAELGIITGAPKERIPQVADHVLFVPAAVYKGTDSRVIQSIQPMGNLFEQHLFLLFDIIVMLLKEEMGLSYEQMESRHRNIE